MVTGRPIKAPADARALEGEPGAPLLEVVGLRTHFHTEEGELKAVDGVSFELGRGRTLAVVGESGCGKSVMAYSILRLINPPGKIAGGSIRLHRSGGEAPLDILELSESSEELYEVRGGRVAFVFQEATAALSPVHTIGNQIIEAIRLHQPLYEPLRRKVSRREARVLAADMLERVGIEDPALCLRQYPHELSGGMRQRAVIAMALVTDPELLIADEPTTALDVTIQAQVLALLKRLQAELQMAILLITHDLGVVSQMADDVLVMYLGRVVERGSVRAVLKKARHPYTMGLIASLPSLTPVGQRLPSVQGSVPALSAIPGGCPFHPRCPYAEPGRCNMGEPPPLEPVGPSGGQAVACWRVREIALERLLERPIEPREGLGLAGDDVPGALRAELPTLPGPDLPEAELPTVPAPDVAARALLTEPKAPSLHDDDAEAAWFEAGEADAEPPRQGRPE